MLEMSGKLHRGAERNLHVANEAVDKRATRQVEGPRGL